jgi:hypothetical protein
MFDQEYRVDGHQLEIRLGYKDVIFVMEDVDAASDVVLSRTLTDQALTKRESQEEFSLDDFRESISGYDEDARTNAIFTKLTEMLSRETNDISRAIKMTSKAIENEMDPDFILTGMDDLQKLIFTLDDSLSRMNTGGNLDVRSPPLNSKGIAAESDGKMKKMASKLNKLRTSNTMIPPKVRQSTFKPKSGHTNMMKISERSKNIKGDKLSLAGLLEVLDGIVDTPGRLLIMTSNHPECLDDALIRPGRIDLVLHLDLMEPREAIAMIEHYFECHLSEEQVERLESYLTNSSVAENVGIPQFSPAEIERFCAQCETVDEFLDLLQEKAIECATDPAFLLPGAPREIEGVSASNSRCVSRSVSEQA